MVTVESLDIRQQFVPTRKESKRRTLKTNLKKGDTKTQKRTVRERARSICQNIRWYNCGELGHFAWDCLKPHKNANIARENEQNRKLAELMDYGYSSVCEECAMIFAVMKNMKRW